MIETCIIRYDIVGGTISKVRETMEHNRYYLIYKERDETADITEFLAITYGANNNDDEYLLVKVKVGSTNSYEYTEVIYSNLASEKNDHTKNTKLKVLKRFKTFLEAYTYAETITQDISRQIFNINGWYSLKDLKNNFKEAE